MKSKVHRPNSMPPSTLNQKTDHAPRFSSAAGTTNEALSARLMLQALSLSLSLSENEMKRAEIDPAPLRDHVDAVEAAMGGIAPTDALEGMLAAQIIGLHEAAVRLMGLAGGDAYNLLSETRMNMAVKLMRAFSSHLEVLSRYRGKGQQKVTVEHVTVQQGGQAIVGNIESKATVGRG